MNRFHPAARGVRASRIASRGDLRQLLFCCLPVAMVLGVYVVSASRLGSTTADDHQRVPTAVRSAEAWEQIGQLCSRVISPDAHPVAITDRNVDPPQERHDDAEHSVERSAECTSHMGNYLMTFNVDQGYLNSVALLHRSHASSAGSPDYGDHLTQREAIDAADRLIAVIENRPTEWKRVRTKARGPAAAPSAWSIVYVDRQPGNVEPPVRIEFDARDGALIHYTHSEVH